MANGLTEIEAGDVRDGKKYLTSFKEIFIISLYLFLIDFKKMCHVEK